MTCEEYKVLLDKDPEDCTRAERWAVMRHQDDCEPCSRYLDDKEAAALKLVTADEVRQAAIDMRKLVWNDVKDPER